MKKKVLKMLLSTIQIFCQVMYRLADLIVKFSLLMMVITGVITCMFPEETLSALTEINRSGQLFQMSAVPIVCMLLCPIYIPQVVHVLVVKVQQIFLRWFPNRMK